METGQNGTGNKTGYSGTTDNTFKSLTNPEAVPTSQPIAIPTGNSHVRYIATIASAIIIVAIIILTITYLYHSISHNTTTRAPTTALSKPVNINTDFINSSVEMSVYYLAALIKSNDFPTNDFYAYFNRYAKENIYSASYQGNYSFSSTDKSLNASYIIGLINTSVYKNGTSFMLKFKQLSTPPPVTQNATLYGISNSYYWCIPTCYSINISNITSITDSLRSLNIKVMPKINYIKIKGISQSNYQGTSCTYAYGTFNYTLLNLSASPDYVVGNFSECFSNRYGIPLKYSMNGTSPIINYHFNIIEISVNSTAPKITPPKV
ncbi:MAG: hypothetical protein M1465_01130 [Candidatus Marsarchaeota archaeon]|jgi:hypothetical protein|nr:hypothetical protein [Candidatus Marsarchaeota archaeon]